MKFCTAVTFSHFLLSKLFPAYIYSFTFTMKLVVTCFGKHMDEDQGKAKSKSFSAEVF